MLNLYVFDASLAKIPAFVREASEADLRATSSWQTNWTGKYVKSLPNKVALCRRDVLRRAGCLLYRRRIKSLSNTSARFLRDITLTRRRRLGSNMIL